MNYLQSFLGVFIPIIGVGAGLFVCWCLGLYGLILKRAADAYCGLSPDELNAIRRQATMDRKQVFRAMLPKRLRKAS